MNYALAKKLKEAGFPIRNAGIKDESFYKRYSMWWPTLSELLEACGEGYYSLVRVKEGDWRCYTENDKGIPKLGGQGATPEEAVANLYLALKGK